MKKEVKNQSDKFSLFATKLMNPKEMGFIFGGMEESEEAKSKTRTRSRCCLCCGCNATDELVAE
jgi:hypothetical protein